MAYGYRRKRTYSNRRKFIRKNRKTRFSRKRFFKRVPRSLMAGTYIPQQAYVKLPFTYIVSLPGIAGGGDWDLGLWGNGITCPLSSGPPGNGQSYPLGLYEYSQFYKYYKVLGSSIKVQINNASTTQNMSFYCVLLASQGIPYNTDTDSNYYQIQDSTTTDLVSYPGASWKLVSNYNGSSNNVYLKGFRKTKTMLGIKDVRDVDETQGLLISQPGTSNEHGLNPGENDSSWFYYLRIDPSDNTSGTSPDDITVIVKMKYYVQLYGRDFNRQAVVQIT